MLTVLGRQHQWFWFRGCLAGSGRWPLFGWRGAVVRFCGVLRVWASRGLVIGWGFWFLGGFFGGFEFIVERVVGMGCSDGVEGVFGFGEGFGGERFFGVGERWHVGGGWFFWPVVCCR